MDFMTPEHKDLYPSSTIKINVKDPTKVERAYMVEPIVHFILRFDPVTDRIFLLERRSITDNYQGTFYHAD